MTTGESDAQAFRLQQMKARRDAQRSPVVPPVRVMPRDDDVRKFIKHPSGNIAFPKSGAAEWPNDSFTRRRIRDGSVTIAEEAKQQQHPAPAR